MTPSLRICQARSDTVLTLSDFVLKGYAASLRRGRRFWVWSFFAAWVLVIVIAGCGSSAPPPTKAAPKEAPTATAEAAPTPAARSEIGGLNEEAVARAFERMNDDVQNCFAKGTTKVSALGGHVKMKLRIDPQGALRWAYMSESTLGDRDTEKCLLDAARAKSWPLPVGGDGLAERDYDVDPPSPVKDLEPKKFKIALALVQKETAKCRKNGTWGKVFRTTAYLRYDGLPISVGIAPPNEKGEDTIDCMIKIIKKIKFGSIGRRMGKVSFDLR
jgi:hypothetical protein